MARSFLGTLACALLPSTLIACSSPNDVPFRGSTGSAAEAGAGGASTGSGAGGATASSTGSTGEGGTGGGAFGAGGAGGAGGGDLGFPDHWIDGLACATEPATQVWKYDDNTYIFRQSLCTNFEGPFLYLLFGEQKAFLQDTGTGDADMAAAVSDVIKKWLADTGKPSIELIVTHSHGHGDHVGGDAQFLALPNTTVVGPSLGDVKSFFGLPGWPDDASEYDLGGRVLDILPIPGHQSAHVAVYDRTRGLLLTGDTLYPGRLYINNWPLYQASIQRLVDFVNAGSPAKWVLGTHIEVNTTGSDYAMGAQKHPDEHPLELDQSILLELNQAVQAMGSSPVYEAHPHFIIYPL